MTNPEHLAQGILSAILKDEGDGLGKALSSFFLVAALPVSAGDLRAVGDVPVAVPFDEGRKLVVHCSTPKGRLGA